MKNDNVVPRGTDSAKVIQVIVTESIKGAGTKEDPVRFIYQYWDFDGNLLAVQDAFLNEASKFIEKATEYKSNR